MKRKIYAIIGALIAVTVLCLSGKLFEDADKSKNYVCQMPITGNYKVWTDGGDTIEYWEKGVPVRIETNVIQRRKNGESI